jgi:hypothetical protein
MPLERHERCGRRLGSLFGQTGNRERILSLEWRTRIKGWNWTCRKSNTVREWENKILNNVGFVEHQQGTLNVNTQATRSTF